jgi:hypothetical protein
MLFLCAFDVIFKFTPIVGELLRHLVGPARHISTDCGHEVDALTDMEFMRGHRGTPCSADPTASMSPLRRWHRDVEVSKVAAASTIANTNATTPEQSKVTNDFFVRPAEPTLTLLWRDLMLLLDHGLGRPGHKVISLRQSQPDLRHVG